MQEGIILPRNRGCNSEDAPDINQELIKENVWKPTTS